MVKVKKNTQAEGPAYRQRVRRLLGVGLCAFRVAAENGVDFFVSVRVGMLVMVSGEIVLAEEMFERFPADTFFVVFVFHFYQFQLGVHSDDPISEKSFCF